MKLFKKNDNSKQRNLSMIKNLVQRVKSRFAVPNPILGRWAHEENFDLKQRKIDLANEDHCHCYEYLAEKKKELEARNKHEELETKLVKN